MVKVTISEKQSGLRDRLKTLMDKKNLKSSEIARITGRSEGTISELLRDKKAFSDKLLNVIYDSLKDYMGEDNLVSTRQKNKIWNIAQAGKTMSDMRLIVGNTGVGKSTVLRKFAEENECCWYIKIDRKEMTWNRFLFRMATEMGIKLDKNRKRFSTSFLLDQIILMVEEKADMNPQVIIDESEVAKNSFYKEFKNLRTATEGLLSIVIAGITDVINKIGKIAGLEFKTYQSASGYAYRWYPTKENSNQYTTFARRISIFRIDNISTEDIASFCVDRGITNKAVIKLACERWWNYEEPDKAFKRAERMGINLSNITVEEFEVL
ncbi:transcriptional regulator with XRE-family HTH domain [Dysgonomonas sp. PFB1-18]|uniref:AAA family ATPase n=1 Tax=unclassified Dysgonomonas TaxID=2630389 RepID=UPI0024733C53|nr:MULTISPECIES: AAA family ATPase [unclassified Dysgonomonas]MDH6309379.1 transcriptional regulator with XRE-family HTH domain [Dysgonomonas sp. PF1-14]MDH6339756.1 transcriptional regulator with XRE-family HTH domain [Dysgonomonas sp. PF1-16]MDH6381404.1 transcriptional regulator with XRE-family HTH domain [Dysgonomonas sp. PFB1-18]MDH6398619.1 transcriptional regulator with XRE-family HTH domain [Dysgonomonas sp. PF1-23]